MAYVSRHIPRIAIRRETRGIGDMIMMEPLFRLFFSTYKSFVLDLYLHRDVLDVHRYHPNVNKIFHVDELQENEYDYIYDLSTPCIDYEQDNISNIIKSRTQIWSEECNIRYEGQSPLLYITKDQIDYGLNYISSLSRKTICIGYKSLDDWRDYPHMDLLIFELAKTYDLVVIDKNKNMELETEISNRKLSSNILQVDNEDLLNVFGIINACSYVVAIDSMVAHVAGAFHLPSYVIFGSIDPKIRLGNYGHKYQTPKKFNLCGKQPCFYSICQGQWCLETIHPWSIVKDVKAMISSN